LLLFVKICLMGCGQPMQRKWGDALCEGVICVQHFECQSFDVAYSVEAYSVMYKWIVVKFFFEEGGEDLLSCSHGFCVVKDWPERGQLIHVCYP